MTVRTKIAASACAALALTVAASAQPAQARWVFHSDNGEAISAPPGGTRAQTCADRLAAVSVRRTYIGEGVDPSTYQIPANARTAVRYEVWKAAPGFDSFDSAREDPDTGEVYFDDDGTRRPATLLARVTTPRRAPLPTPLPVDGNPHTSESFVFTSAPISVRLRGVAPGDALGLRPAQEQGFTNVTAMDCRLPLLTASADVRPGSRANTVRPTNRDELVPVRVFGSRRLSVRRITTVHLGEAAPAAVPTPLQPSLRPRDVNRDGRLDRLYYFRQDATDIMCIDTSVKVTGQTSDRKRFERRTPITTAGCDG